jgi:hypothetical protein
MLEGLNRVNWARLTDAYGPAANTPDHIRQLASSRPKERKEARQALYATIFHQGTRYPATAPAVPFLFDLLDDPATPEKGEIVRLLVHLAVGYPEQFLPLGIDPAAAFAEAAPAAPAPDDDSPAADAYWARQAYEAVRRRVGRFRALAGDADAKTRKAAVFALAWFPAAARTSAPVVRQAARGPGRPDERANAILCLGILGRHLGGSSDATWLQEQLGPDRPYAVRVTAAISLGVLLGRKLPAEALDVLLAAVQDADRDVKEGPRVSWEFGSLICHTCEALRSLALRPAEPVLSALCRAAETVQPYWPSLTILRTLLELVFRDRKGVRHVRDPNAPDGRRRLYRDPARLTAAQRRALEAIVRSPYWKPGQSFFGPHEEEVYCRGLPADQDKLRRLLAGEQLDPPYPPAPPKPPPLDLRKVQERAREYVREFEEQDRRLPLQGNNWYGTWYAGTSTDGRPMLVFFNDDNLWVCWFDDDGRHRNTEVMPNPLGDRAKAYPMQELYPRLENFLRERFGYQAGTIHVRPFSDPVSGAAIKAGPGLLDRFILNPKGEYPEFWPRQMVKERRQVEAKQVLEWVEKRDRYILRVPPRDHPIDIGDGHCIGDHLV